MRNESKANSGLLIVAVVAIVAIVSLTIFFSTNNTRTSDTSGVDAAIDQIQGDTNTAGAVISIGTRNCLHNNCDTAANQHACVCSKWLGCEGDAEAPGLNKC